MTGCPRFTLRLISCTAWKNVHRPRGLLTQYETEADCAGRSMHLAVVPIRPGLNVVVPVGLAFVHVVTHSCDYGSIICFLLVCWSADHSQSCSTVLTPEMRRGKHKTYSCTAVYYRPRRITVCHRASPKIQKNESQCQARSEGDCRHSILFQSTSKCLQARPTSLSMSKLNTSSFAFKRTLWWWRHRSPSYH